VFDNLQGIGQDVEVDYVCSSRMLHERTEHHLVLRTQTLALVHHHFCVQHEQNSVCIEIGIYAGRPKVKLKLQNEPKCLDDPKGKR